MRKRSIDFIGIGAERSGTTWISECLRSHPEICLSKKKEIMFFNGYDPHFQKVKNLKYNRGFGWYLDQFSHCSIDSIKGEFTPTYLYSKKTAQRIKKHLPKVKLIVVMRNPYDRAYSGYKYNQSMGIIDKKMTFSDAIRKHSIYTEKGLYFKYLSYYCKLFPPRNIHLIFYEDICNSPGETIKELYKFLGVKDTKFKPPALSQKINVATQAKMYWLNSFFLKTRYLLEQFHLDFILRILEQTGLRNLIIRLKDLNSVKIDNDIKIDKKTKNYMQQIFMDDIKDLDKFTHRDLSGWLQSYI